jgi:hypothetical protein
MRRRRKGVPPASDGDPAATDQGGVLTTFDATGESETGWGSICVSGCGDDSGANAESQQQAATLNVSMSSGATNNSGVDFPRGGIGPVESPGQGWSYNVLLTGTLDAGVDASQYQIKQTVKITGSEVTEGGKKYPLNGNRSETLAPADTKYWAVKGNVIYAHDSPGLRNIGPDDKFVKSATLKMHFESWVAHGNVRISPVVKWDVGITVRESTKATITGGLE